MTEDAVTEDELVPMVTLEERTITTGSLYVNVDWLDLLEHHNGDEAAAFEQLGKLKDLLA